jgi:hypothetical protein
MKTIVIGSKFNDFPKSIHKTSKNIICIYMDQFILKGGGCFKELPPLCSDRIIELSEIADRLSDQWYRSIDNIDISKYNGNSIGEMVKVPLFYKILDYLLFIESISKLIVYGKYKNIYVSSDLYWNLDEIIKEKCIRYDKNNESIVKVIFLKYATNFKMYLKDFFYKNITLKSYFEYIFIFDKNIDALSNLLKYMERSGAKCCSISNKKVKNSVNIRNKFFYVNPLFIFKILLHIKNMRLEKINGCHTIGFFANEIIYSMMNNYVLIKNVDSCFEYFGNVKTFITSTDVHPFSMAVIAKARKLGKKSVQIQHGSFGGDFSSKIAFSPLRSDKFYIWGEGFTQDIVNFGVDRDSLVIVGCMLPSLNKTLDSKLSVINNNIYKILYISANYTGPIKYYYFTQVMEAILKTNINIELTIRIHPGSNDTYSYYSDLNNSTNLNIKLDKNKSLIDSINKADLIINVSLSSTHVKSLIYTKDSIAYTPFSQIKPQKKIKNIANDVDGLIKLINLFYKESKMKSVVPADNENYIYAYGEDSLDNAYDLIKRGI